MFRLSIGGRGRTTESWLESLKPSRLYSSLASEARKGVKALASATPVETGATAAAWNAKVDISSGGATITWTNSETVSGSPLVILLQYGHGTGTGGFVVGRDFINPAIQPVMDEIANNVWKKVTSG